MKTEFEKKLPSLYDDATVEHVEKSVDAKSGKLSASKLGWDKQDGWTVTDEGALVREDAAWEGYEPYATATIDEKRAGLYKFQGQDVLVIFEDDEDRKVTAYVNGGNAKD